MEESKQTRGPLLLFKRDDPNFLDKEETFINMMVAKYGESGNALRTGIAPCHELPNDIAKKPRSALTAEENLIYDRCARRDEIQHANSHKIIGEILGALSEELLQEIKRGKNHQSRITTGAYLKIWKRVRRAVLGTGDTTEARRLQARNDLLAIKMITGQTVIAHIDRFERTLHRCHQLGVELDEKTVINTLVFSLTQDYLDLAMDIKNQVPRNMKPAPTTFKETRDYIIEYVETKATLMSAMSSRGPHQASGAPSAFVAATTAIKRARPASLDDEGSSHEGCEYCKSNPSAARLTTSWKNHRRADCFKDPTSPKYRPLKKKKEKAALLATEESAWMSIASLQGVEDFGSLTVEGSSDDEDVPGPWLITQDSSLALARLVGDETSHPSSPTWIATPTGLKHPILDTGCTTHVFSLRGGEHKIANISPLPAKITLKRGRRKSHHQPPRRTPRAWKGPTGPGRGETG